MASKASCWLGCNWRVGWRSGARCELEMERFDFHAGEDDQGAITLVLNLSEKILRASRRYFERVQFEGCGGAAPNHHGHFLGLELKLPRPS